MEARIEPSHRNAQASPSVHRELTDRDIYRFDTPDSGKFGFAAAVTGASQPALLTKLATRRRRIAVAIAGGETSSTSLRGRNAAKVRAR